MGVAVYNVVKKVPMATGFVYWWMVADGDLPDAQLAGLHIHGSLSTPTLRSLYHIAGLKENTCFSGETVSLVLHI